MFRRFRSLSRRIRVYVRGVYDRAYEIYYSIKPVR
jgi:hypothetical protein